MSTTTFYSASGLFTGDQWLHDHAIVSVNGIIRDIVPAGSLSLSSADHIHFENCTIAPAFIDLQIYGAGEKLFAEYPTTEALQLLNDYCTKGGAALCLPTVATNKQEVFFACIDAVREYWASGGKGIGGLHLEGPWINAVRRGAHIEALIHVPTADEVREYLEYGKDCIKMITLAPEQCSPAVLSLIRSYNIIISAGHSNATYNEAKAGFSNGITAVTHLFNAMSPLQHRAPGLAGAAMDDDSVMASIIPDGHHVDFAAIRIAKQVMKERLFVITDAVTTTGSGYYKHQPSGDKYEADGILSGSALTMCQAVKNLVQHKVADLPESLRMCSLYPARLMQLDDKYGTIATGMPICFVVLDENLNVVQLIQ